MLRNQFKRPKKRTLRVLRLKNVYAILKYDETNNCFNDVIIIRLNCSPFYQTKKENMPQFFIFLQISLKECILSTFVLREFHAKKWRDTPGKICKCEDFSLQNTKYQHTYLHRGYRDQVGGAPRVRPYHCTPVWLNFAITYKWVGCVNCYNGERRSRYPLKISKRYVFPTIVLFFPAVRRFVCTI